MCLFKRRFYRDFHTGSIHLGHSLDEDAWCVDVIRVDFTWFHQVLYFSSRLL